jgi:hypothetical protein
MHRKPKDNSRALAAFIAKKAEIDTMLQRLQALPSTVGMPRSRKCQCCFSARTEPGFPSRSEPPLLLEIEILHLVA